MTWTNTFPNLDKYSWVALHCWGKSWGSEDFWEDWVWQPGIGQRRAGGRVSLYSLPDPDDQYWTDIWTNIFHNLVKYIYPFGQIYFAIWTNVLEKNMFDNSNKNIWQSEQMHWQILTNTFCNSDKYILQSRQIYFAI